jgi:hypothetical protein
MSRHFLLIAVALGPEACQASAPPSPPAAGLDWSAPCRWVHVDTVTPKSAPQFEAARHRWLATLRGKRTFMPDGRPLFWTGMHGGRRTYLTFYPFEKFVELDRRREQVRETQEVLRAALGDERGSAVALDLGAILSTEDQFEIERRDDLSNLPPSKNSRRAT